MQKELLRLNDYLKEYPCIDIWVVSKDIAMGEAYWKWIKKNIDIKKKPRILSSNKNKIDGLNSNNAIILLCGHWFMNPIRNTDTFDMLLNNAKITLPIGEIQ